MEKEENEQMLINQITNLNLVINNLLESGYGSKLTDSNNDTALIIATKCGLYELVYRMLEHFKDIDINNTILSEPLHLDHHVGDSIFKETVWEKSNLCQIINKRDINNKSALDYAMEKQKYDVACVLLRHGASISALNKEQLKELLLYSSSETHERYALQDHDLRPVVGLLSIKIPEAVIHYSDDYEYPRLLSYFCYNGHSKIVASLIDAITDKNRQKQILNNGDNHSMPLNGANNNGRLSDQDHLEIVKCLFELGASKAHNFDSGIHCTLQAAADRGHMETFKYFVNRADKKDFNTYIGLATAGDHINLVKYIWENYRQYTTTSSKNTALHYAGWRGKLTCVKYLCENGAQLNCTNNEGETPLDNAIEYNEIGVIKYLVEHGARVGVKCNIDLKLILGVQDGIDVKKGDNLLHDAIKLGEMVFIKHLVTQGIDVNKHNSQGVTPLHLSVQKVSAKITRYLLQHGAFYDIPTRDNIPAVGLSKYENTLVLHTIHYCFMSLNLFKDLNEMIRENTNYDDAYDPANPMVYLVTVKNSQKQTLLHKAATLNDKEAVELIMKYNDAYISMSKKFPHAQDYITLDISSQDSQGNTALHLAASNGNFEIIKVLLKANANIDIKNNAGHTAVYLAAKNGHKRIVEHLLAKTPDSENTTN